MADDLSRHMWVFAHGSLMFSPGFEPEAVVPARVWGYERRFGQPSVRNWGSIGYPAPTCSLTRGDSCDGLALALPLDQTASTFRTILAREASPGVAVAAETTFGDVQAHTWPMDSTWNHMGANELADAALVNIANGGGPSGDAWMYVSGVESTLTQHGLTDRLVTDYHHVLQTRLSTSD